MKIKKFGSFVNENLRPGFESSELAALILPVINQVKEASFTEEAKREGNISNEQVLGLIISKLTGWDYEKISAVAAYAYEDSNYSEEAERMFKEAGITEAVSEKKKKKKNDVIPTATGIIPTMEVSEDENNL
jgi:transposase